MKNNRNNYKMKKIKFISTTLILFVLINLTSCTPKDEVIDPAFGIGNNNSGGGTGGGGGTTTKDYWPAAINNQWIFSKNGIQQAPMKIVSETTTTGKTYYAFNQQTFTMSNNTNTSPIASLRKSNGDYFIKTDNVVVAAQGSLPGTTTTGSEVLYLKDKLPVGGAWTSSFVQTTTYSDPAFPLLVINFNINSSIAEKITNLTVNGKAYSDVIKVTHVQAISGIGQTTYVNNYYWFANNVGPIKIQTQSGGQVFTQELVSYIVN